MSVPLTPLAVDGPAPADPGPATPGPAVGGRRRVRRPGVGLVLAVLWIAVVLVAVAAPGLLGAGSPQATDTLASLQRPGEAHWFGADQLGRDLYARVVHGARYSVVIALLAVAFAVTLGTALGLAAALGGRVVDEVLTRLLDLLSAFPSILMALLFAAFVGRGVVNLAVAVGIAAVPGFARLIRRQARALLRADFVTAAVTYGASRASVVARHVVPGAVSSVLLLAAIEVGTSILTVSGISFVGLGPERPAPEWGSLLAEGRTVLTVAWWPSAFPGVAIVLTILAFTALGRHLQRTSERRLPA